MCLINICSYLLFCSLFLIIVQTNPVYAVFSFIFSAGCTFFLLILLGAEFFALLILIIYIGVITILFLFVVIMYNLKYIQLDIEVLLLNPFFTCLFVKVLWMQLLCLEGLELLLIKSTDATTTFFTLDVVYLTELFNCHFFIFLICGLLIFIAMLGSIVVTYPFYKAYQ